VQASPNQDKLFFPALGLTKADLLRYYLDLAAHVASLHLQHSPDRRGNNQFRRLRSRRALGD